MPAPVERTLQEPPEKVVPRVALLTYVLSYDDLLQPHTRTFPLERVRRPLEIRRGASGADGPVLVGQELRLADRWLSGEHARLERSGDDDILVDAGSRNGTFLNGRKVTRERVVDGDLIEVGHSLLLYRVVDAAAAARLEGDAEPRLGPTRTFNPEVAGLVADLERLARSRESVLLLAETGAGKEIAAQMIHDRSGRTGSYCAVDCGAIPETLFESTFFGHKRGAFTGADARTGEILRADGGTLFLDEVANMSVAAQAKLLRVIEDGRVVPLGGSDAHEVDVRWLAATNRDLFADERAFRPDLLRRLAGYVAHIPPLRQRREDLGVLAAYLLADAGVTRASITAAAGRKLFASPLAGNVRQLRTVLRSAAVLAGDGPMDVAHLGRAGTERDAPVEKADANDLYEADADEPADEARRAGRPPDAGAIDAALLAEGGNVVRAARRLHAHPRQLYRWIDKHALSLDKYRG